MQPYGAWLTDEQKIAAYRRIIGNLRRGQCRDLTQRQQLDVRKAIAEAQSFIGTTGADLESTIAVLRGMIEELLGKQAAKAEGLDK